MRLALIGSTGHWQTYAPALVKCPGLEVVGVARAEDETLEAFDAAPGVRADTPRFGDPERLLDQVKPDIVQVCCRPDLNPYWSLACIERGIPVISEKPLAMDMRTLKRMHSLVERKGVRICPMHTMREERSLAAVARVVKEGRIGRPLMCFSQKTYKWGPTRPCFFRDRKTFPGIMPYIGVHAMDWLHWILGDVFVEVYGREGTAARPDYPACASQAAYTFRMESGGAAAVTLDYLRPSAAPTHGDEWLRIAGTQGVVEARVVRNEVTLVTEREGPTPVALEPQLDIASQFIRFLRNEGPEPLTHYDAFRITEITIKAQQSADTGKPVSLHPSAFDGKA